MTDITPDWQETDSAFFIEHGEVITPARAEQFSTIARLVPAHEEEHFVAVDLACGTGKLSSAILDRFPRCRVLALDGSEAMLRQARRTLSGFSDRVVFGQFELRNREWVNKLPDEVRCFVSSLAIHHLDGVEKQSLFRVLVRRLNPGGAFLIADIVEPVNDCARALYADAWDQTVREQSHRLGGSLEQYNVFADGWNHYRTPDVEFDKPSRLFEQLQWLADAGFKTVDCFWLRAGHAIYGGYR